MSIDDGDGDDDDNGEKYCRYLNNVHFRKEF